MTDEAPRDRLAADLQEGRIKDFAISQDVALTLDALDAAEARVRALEGALTPFVGEHECDGHATVERFDMAVAVSVRWSDVIQGRAALNTGGQ